MSITQEFAFVINNSVGLVSALAWSEAIKSLFHKKVVRFSPMIGPVAYAALVTLIAYVVSKTIGTRAKAQCTTLCTPRPTSPPDQPEPEPAWPVRG